MWKLCESQFSMQEIQGYVQWLSQKTEVTEAHLLDARAIVDFFFLESALKK